MSTIPDSLRNAKRYIREQTNFTAVISIRAARSRHGYHAGYDDIYGPSGEGDKDYSVKRKRDQEANNVPTGRASRNASSAMDITFPSGSEWRREFTPWLAARAKAKLADIQECVGPNASGEATYWGKSTGWRPVPSKIASHKYHTHISFPRDTEFKDRTGMFKAFFEAP